jgi:hypothetical protein
VAAFVLNIFFAKSEDNITSTFLQKDPEEQENYKEALPQDPDRSDELHPSVARRCRCSA